jgi:hypothetical protein
MEQTAKSVAYARSTESLGEWAGQPSTLKPGEDFVVSGPRFGYDTHPRRMRDACETVCETQGEMICTISMRLALWFPR